MLLDELLEHRIHFPVPHDLLHGLVVNCVLLPQQGAWDGNGHVAVEEPTEHDMSSTYIEAYGDTAHMATEVGVGRDEPIRVVRLCKTLQA